MADTFDSLISSYKKTLRGIGSLPELPMRRARLDEALRALPVDERVWWIDQLIRGALWGKSREIDAMLACSSWLIRLRLDDDYDVLQRMYMAAHDAGRESILFLLRDIPPHQALGPGARLPEVRLPHDRDITLGERRWMASGRDRGLLKRLLRDNDPLVIDRLLENPHLNVDDVLTVTTRRPTLPKLLLTVALSDRWVTEYRIRESLVSNPFGPTGVSLKLLPTIHINTLRKLRHAGDLHPSIAEAAEVLITLREQRTAPWGH